MLSLSYEQICNGTNLKTRVGLYVLVPNSDLHLICSWYWIYVIPRSRQPPDLENSTANIFSPIPQIGLPGHASSCVVLWVVPSSSKLFYAILLLLSFGVTNSDLSELRIRTLGVTNSDLRSYEFGPRELRIRTFGVTNSCVELHWNRERRSAGKFEIFGNGKRRRE